MPEPCNIALRLRAQSERLGDKPAVLVPVGRDAGGHIRYDSLTFRELDAESDAFAHGFADIGLGRGILTLVMIRPGLEFFSVMFALFKVGAVPVLIDPGMGKERLLHCIQGAAPQALIGIPLAHAARLVHPRFFCSVKHFVTVGRRWFWGGHALARLRRPTPTPFPVAQTSADELAAILFTTGSTGPAKGVEYEHGMFAAQCRILEETYGVRPDEKDLPTFPPFALFSVALGMTAVIPDMDPTRPAEVDPKAVIGPIQEQQCTFSFGSPALWARVTQYCVDHGITLPSLRRVLMAGAPVPPEVHERFTSVLAPGATTHTPYGATESLPTTDITGQEVLAETASATRDGEGVCVGRPVHGVEVQIIALTDAAILDWSDDLIAPAGQVGEIVTSGPNVTKRYYSNPEATAAGKIRDGESVRHRMGDLGYLDDAGRLWFCGRKAHRVETAEGVLFSVCCEAIYNQHPQVRRAALVGMGSSTPKRPGMVIEPVVMPGSPQARRALVDELRALGHDHPRTRMIHDILLHPRFPVDIRHNAKIDREQLAAWATEQLTRARPAGGTAFA